MMQLGRLARAIEMSGRIVDAIDHPETMTSPDRIRLIFERDAIVKAMNADELRLFRLWTAQEQPS